MVYSVPVTNEPAITVARVSVPNDTIVYSAVGRNVPAVNKSLPKDTILYLSPAINDPAVVGLIVNVFQAVYADWFILISAA